jgi:rare lipoprotein A (peptidoglycan hydrolase)
MTTRAVFRSYVWRVGLMLSLLLAEGSSGLAIARYRAAQRQPSHRDTHRVRQVGNASWYGTKQHGQHTARGERFHQQQLTAAPRRLPLGTIAKVTNLETGQGVQVKLNDRGPQAKGCIIDLSRAAAQWIGRQRDGTARVRVEVIPSQDSQAALADYHPTTRAEQKRG